MSAEKNWQFELEEYIKQGEKRIMESLQKKEYIRRVDGKRYGKWEVLIQKYPNNPDMEQRHD